MDQYYCSSAFSGLISVSAPVLSVLRVFIQEYIAQDKTTEEIITEDSFADRLLLY